ncbi:General transcription factor IIH subunit 3 [Folsomia candida]|uniref:General transcription factor IIH subunit 3 n=1 Tax=Folsomia candida TaxID=158441 RepID=A0A226ELR0_FOLCA|nr:General transcription factor IIH subunit 3 [Folsomia candida]
MEPTEQNLLVVVMDVNPAQKYVRSDIKSFFHVVDSVLTFCNAHLMLHADNKVCIIASHVNQSHFLYPLEIRPGQQSKVTRQTDGQHEVFLELERCVRNQIKRLIMDESFGKFDSSAAVIGANTATCLASSLSRALCYIHRKDKETRPGEKLNSRILVVSGSSESTAQYMAFMNGVIIDACVLGSYATLLSQGADITGGINLRPPHISGLLQYLMWVFLPDVTLRKQLALPPPDPVDYRAACFCHRQLIDQGHVCSVCLSIFCKFSPICTTCNAVFKAPPMVLPKAKKKRPAAGNI